MSLPIPASGVGGGHVTDTQNRFEVKYLVGTAEVPGLLRAFEGFLEPDRHNEPGRGYLLYSTYWDSPDLAFFWEKIEGLKFRRKLRLRRYAGSPDAWLEIKQRIDRTQQKRRLRLSVEDARAALDPERSMDLPVEGMDPVLAEARVLIHRYRLSPRVGILYRRQAYLGRFEPGVRVNFDSRIQYRAQAVDLTEPFAVGKYVVGPATSVMEIKFTDRVPLWLTKTIARLGLPMVRLSKYCSAIDREYFDGTLT